MDTTSVHERTQPNLSPAALFVLTCMWIVVALAGGRFAGKVVPPLWFDAGRELATAAMLFAGFYLLARVGVRDLRPLSSVGFVKRPSLTREFGIGAALGWSVGIALMLPALFSRNLVLSFHTSASAMQQTALSLVALIAWALVLQLVLSGLPTRLLVRSVKPAWTVVAVLIVTASLAGTSSVGQRYSLMFAVLATSLFLTAFLRTRAIWLSLGLQIGWSVSLQLLFGAPSPSLFSVGSVVQNSTGGPVWLTGAPYGPELSMFGVPILLTALIILFRVTRTYAWHYTFQPITPAGYPVEIAPPAEHLKEEQRSKTNVPLVQIGGVTSTPPSADPIHKS